jgi:hypothetical protein
MIGTPLNLKAAREALRNAVKLMDRRTKAYQAVRKALDALHEPGCEMEGVYEDEYWYQLDSRMKARGK